MLRFHHLLTLGVAMSVVAALLTTSRAESQGDKKVRLGTYDSRAIAMAWVRSKHSSIAGKMKELQQAKAAGDEEKVQQLNAWGEMRQRELHFQGFGKYPVDDYIDKVQAELPGIMKQHQLDAIVWMCHSHRDDVEIVDVTADLMKLFAATDQVIEQAKELKNHEPLDFVTLFKMDPRD